MMSPFTLNLLLSTLLTALFCVHDAESQVVLQAPPTDECPFYHRGRSFITDVSIQPTTFNFNCTEDGIVQVKELIQRVADRKFRKYLAKTSALGAVEVDAFCGGPGLGTQKLRPSGWTYTSSSKCTFCGEDNYDAGGGPNESTPPNLKNDTIVIPFSGDGPNRTYDITVEINNLRTKLQRQLTRVFTRKINHHRKSCLVGSESQVNVTVTRAEGPDIAETVCP